MESIASQTHSPDIVLIVIDPSDSTIKSAEEIREQFSSCLNVILTMNNRTENLSGAINSGLAFLLAKGFDPIDTYIAILDDDDIWDTYYLEACFRAAKQGNHDWVYAGLIRHTSKDDLGRNLSIPSDIAVGDFYIGNPNIQGSNLFVRLLSLLQAGGFDEALESTTDRDVCIRLLDLGHLRIQRIGRHLVHHYALPDTNRLSEPENQRKRQGLLYFYLKHALRMPDFQRASFRERALNFFEVDIDKELLQKSKSKASSSSSEQNEGTIRLIVGIIATRQQSLRVLLDDLALLQENADFIRRVVIVDNCGDTRQLSVLVEQPEYSALNILIRTREEIDSDLRARRFGNYVTKSDFRESIAGGRSVLHHYLYEESVQVPGSIVWVMDDDIRLSYLTEENKTRRLKTSEITSEVFRLKKMGAAIGALRVTGDPPIPGFSTLRTQLLDVFYNLSQTETNTELETKMAQHAWTLLLGHDEYFYDYSQSHYCHLEFPALNPLHNKDIRSQIVKGKALTRPRIWPAEMDNERVFLPIGGSYFVLNPECLREFPVTSPDIDGIRGRRGDTFWGMLNRYVRGRDVVQCDIAIQHVRDSRDPGTISLDSLFSDFIGSSFVKSMDDYYREQEKRIGVLPARVRLTINHEERDSIIKQFFVHLNERRIQYLLNSYRIQGILVALKQLDGFKQNILRIRELVEYLKPLFTTSQIEQFNSRLLECDKANLESFLDSLKVNIKSYRQSSKLGDSDDEFISYSKRIVNNLNLDRNLSYLGKGREGVVWSDGRYTYKHFRSGWSQFGRGHSDFLGNHILQANISNSLVRLEQIMDDDGEVIFQIELYEGEKYKGGFLEDIIQLLKDCRMNEIAISNFHPHNLIVGPKGLKFCDIGRSIIPFSEREFWSMAKRAYLTYRFHFRDDLDEIMSLALYDESIPELVGFDVFFKMLEDSTKSDVLDRLLEELVKSKRPSRVLDYGCGKGQISENLAKNGIEVIAYDIDSSIIERNRQRESTVRYLDKEGLDTHLDEMFDCVLCSLVLCTIENDDEVGRVISDLRKAVSKEGRVIVAICNPFFTAVSASEVHCKSKPIDQLDYDSTIIHEKIIRETGRVRIDIHRPYSWYEHTFHQCGFSMVEFSETRNIDTARILPSSEFLIIELKPIPTPVKEKVSLLIKASPIEWKTIDFQIRHIVSQLEGPQQFHEKIVITDRHEGPFLRAYDEPNQKQFGEILLSLQEEGIVDKIVYAPYDELTVRSTFLNWFGVEATSTHSRTGQHVYTTLYGFDQCTGDYILQVDSDCMIYRADRSHDYLGEMIEVLERDPKGLTVSFNIAHSKNMPYTSSSGKGKWRVEVRCCLFNRSKLNSLRPLPNSVTEEGILVNAWHRALDHLLEASDFKSFRGGTNQTFFIHVPNDRKSNPTDWFNIIKCVERGVIPGIQMGQVDLTGTLEDWIGGRDEEFLFLIRGRNTPLPLVRRCIDSVKQQTGGNWGLVFIDAASQNGLDEYIESILKREFDDKISVLRNYEPLPAIQNIFIATKSICSNPESVIIHLDADDALIGSDALGILRDAYANGADVTVGSMLRLDKHKEYPVDFQNPRGRRGGNVWQHLRSFKKYLFDSIKEEDLKIDNEWIPIAEDWAFMLPIVEMGTNPIHIKEILYLYEPGGQKTDEIRSAREKIIEKIVAKPRYKPSDVIWSW